MADDTDSGFVPEPVPDDIADTEINGLNPVDTSTDESQVEEVSEETTQDQPEDDTEVEESEDEPSNTAEKEPEQPEQKPQPVDEEAQKHERNAEQAARRVEQKQQRDYVAEQRKQIREYQRTADPDDIKAQLEVIKANQYVDTVERNRTAIVGDAMRAQQEIELFNPTSKNFQPSLYKRAIDRFNDSYVVTDPDTGEVLGAQDRQGNNVSLYQYLQQEAASIQDVLSGTQRQTQRSEARMRSKAVNPSNPGKVTSSGDEEQDLLDRIGDIDLTKLSR